MSGSPASARDRAAAYVAKVPPAISGQHGNDHAYKLAATLVRGFALSVDESFDLLRPWNATCQPPWSDRELLTIIENAAKYGKGAIGGKLGAMPSRRSCFATPEELLATLLSVLRDPLDPEQTVRDLAGLGIVAQPDPAGDLRARKTMISWLLAEADEILPWRRRAPSGRANASRIPPADRGAALLAAAGSYLTAVKPPPPEQFVAWIMEEAARQHFACHPPRKAERAEIHFSPGAFEALVTPLARDGSTRARTPQEHSESSAKATPRVHPQAPFPDDPETLAAREEALAQFRATLTPTEQAVFDQPFSEAEAVVALRVGTTAKTVHSTRNRIRKKAKAWGQEHGGESVLTFEVETSVENAEGDASLRRAA
jgi:hypothetical protein